MSSVAGCLISRKRESEGESRLNERRGDENVCDYTAAAVAQMKIVIIIEGRSDDRLDKVRIHHTLLRRTRIIYLLKSRSRKREREKEISYGQVINNSSTK